MLKTINSSSSFIYFVNLSKKQINKISKNISRHLNGASSIKSANDAYEFFHKVKNVPRIDRAKLPDNNLLFSIENSFVQHLPIEVSLGRITIGSRTASKKPKPQQATILWHKPQSNKKQQRQTRHLTNSLWLMAEVQQQLPQ
ncbi:8216_t:CDS:2 [Entrophospora sp. SA101]|nr:8216_t:CDS:2 [Entrophospora sp. SA101]